MRLRVVVLAGAVFVGGLVSVAPAAAGSTPARHAVAPLAAVAPGLQASELEAVSCPTSTWCAAIGGLNAGDALPGGTSDGASRPAAWIGSSSAWAATVLPLPSAKAGVPYAQLTAISCPRPGRCVAVGTYDTSAKINNEGVLIETLTGTTWRATSVPLIANTFPIGMPPYLAGVACRSTTACVAVGTALALTGHGEMRPIAYRLSARRWTGRLVSAPAKAQTTDLRAVSCPTARRCVAIGAFEAQGGTYRALAETLTGSSWKATTGFGPAGSNLLGISCATASTCTAVGATTHGALAVTLTRHRWEAHIFPPFGTSHAYPALDGVSCLPSVCVAVGAYSARPRGTIVETRSNGRWSAPATVRGASGLVAVSCAAAGICTAVNQSWFAAGVATQAAGHWTFHHLASPPAQPVAALAAISCPSVTGSCVAVGAYQHGAGVGDLIETRTTRGWIPTVTAPTRLGAGLDGVSCAPGSAVTSGCTAVGGDAIATDTTGRWMVTALQIPHGWHDVDLNAVTCLRPRSCVAVGDVTNAQTGLMDPLVARRSGSRWHTQVIPAQGGSVGATLAGVSCPTISSCVAVGWTNWGIGGGDSGGLAEQLVNGQWKATNLGPEGFGATYASVSCAAPGHCVAVGTASFDSTVARLAGTTWQAVTVAHSTYTQLTAVSCPTRSRCEAASMTDDRGRTLAIVTITAKTALLTAILDPPRSATIIGLSGLSCPSQQHCGVAGGDEGPAGAFAVAATW